MKSLKDFYTSNRADQVLRVVLDPIAIGVLEFSTEIEATSRIPAQTSHMAQGAPSFASPESDERTPFPLGIVIHCDFPRSLLCITCALTLMR